MNRFVIFLLALFFSISAFAYNFTGKTFRGTCDDGYGGEAVVTFSFKANNKCSSTLKIPGQKTQYGNLIWEVAGGFINLFEVGNGDYMYLTIDQDCDDDGDCGEIYLVACDSNGMAAMELYEVKNPSKNNSKKRSSKKR